MNLRRSSSAIHSLVLRRLGRAVPLGPVLLAGALLSGCAPDFPPAAAGLLSDASFKARIARDFPPGSPAARLRAELEREGFRFLDDPVTRLHSALDRPDNLPCFSETRIDWREDRRGRIVEIQAQRLDCT